MFERGSGGCEVVRLLASVIILSAGIVAGAPHCAAADQWGGSIAVASDYIVRGISRTDDRAALQLDLHFLSSSGFLAGLFASNTRINSGEPSNAEIDAFLGYAWTSGSDWRGKILFSHYAYPWNRAGSAYDYDELLVDASYQEWLNIALDISPNEPLFVGGRGLVGVTAKSLQLNLQRPLFHRLSVAGGVGYSYFDGPEPGGYEYWSIGAVYELAKVTLAVSYVDTTAGAKALFYNAAADNRWVGTVIWRF
jgi:uncharacterized protein (TIGR02001 family)